MRDEADPRDDLESREIKPIVPLPRARMTGVAISVLCGVLGLGLFTALDAKRRAPAANEADAAAPQTTISSPPNLTIPQLDPPAPQTEQVAFAETIPNIPQFAAAYSPSPPPAAQYAAAPVFAPPPASPSPTPTVSARPTRAPSASAGSNDGILLMDVGPGDGRVTVGAKDPAAEGAAGDEQAVRATVIRNRSSLVSQGTMIPAVLETPINSSRAGLARAIVTADVRGFDGSRVLIPRGSRLIGEAKGDAQAGQKRVLVNWTRLIRPDGVAIRIGSPAADSLGGAGIKGSVNTYFLERFGNAILQTSMSIGIAKASRSAGDSVLIGVSGQAGGTIAQTPIFNVPAGPTIAVSQGAQISIFVAKDLDFGGVGARQ